MHLVPNSWRGPLRGRRECMRVLLCALCRVRLIAPARASGVHEAWVCLLRAWVCVFSHVRTRTSCTRVTLAYHIAARTFFKPHSPQLSYTHATHCPPRTFFKLHSPKAGALEITALLGVLGATVYEFSKVRTLNPKPKSGVGERVVLMGLLGATVSGVSKASGGC